MVIVELLPGPYVGLTAEWEDFLEIVETEWV
jgi:hypothetical protein